MQVLWIDPRLIPYFFMGLAGIISVINVMVFAKRVANQMKKFEEAIGYIDSDVEKVMKSPITNLERGTTSFAALSGALSLILCFMFRDSIGIFFSFIMASSSGLTIFQMVKSTQSPFLLPSYLRHYASIYPLVGLIALSVGLFRWAG